MILESDTIASRTFGTNRSGLPAKLEAGHGFGVPTATRGAAMSKLPYRLTKYGYQRKPPLPRIGI